MDLRRSIEKVLHPCAKWLQQWTRGLPANLFREGPPNAKLLGRKGERLAARHLRRAGYKILYRNYRPHCGGEVDIVCRIPGELVVVFVEVKTRSSVSHGTPSEAVHLRKQRRIILAAQEWISLLNVPDVRAQFDVVEVVHCSGKWTLNHIRSAFQVLLTDLSPPQLGAAKFATSTFLTSKAKWKLCYRLPSPCSKLLSTLPCTQVGVRR
jgi:putative endonuclease